MARRRRRAEVKWEMSAEPNSIRVDEASKATADALFSELDSELRGLAAAIFSDLRNIDGHRGDPWHIANGNPLLLGAMCHAPSEAEA